MTQAGLPPGDIEKIAAFLDRRLPEEERREFLDRLDRDEALYEVFVETVRYRDEAGHEATNLVEHPASRDWARWLGPAAIAAMLVLVIAGPLILGRGVSESEFAAALVGDGALERSLGESWYDQGWTEFRGGGPTREEKEAAFRSGVRALELEVALRLGRRDEGRVLTRDLQRELAGLAFIDYARMYAGVLERLDRGSDDESLDEILREALEVENDVRATLGEVSPDYTFGKWAETGRLSAQSGNEELLRARSFRAALRAARQQEWGGGIEERLDLIAGQIDHRGTTLDLGELERAFQEIIDSH